MTTTTDRYAVDSGARQVLALSYAQLVKAGNDSVRAAWRFGQTIDSLSDTYTRQQLADAIGLSAQTIYRYHRFYGAYQRPELALAAADQLETYNIDTLWRLANDLDPLVEHGRPLAGRRYRYRCARCASTEVRREEIEPEPEDQDQADVAAHTRPVSPVRFQAVS